MNDDNIGSGAYSFVKRYGNNEVVKQILDYPDMTGIGSWRDYMIYLLSDQLLFGSLRLVPYNKIISNKSAFNPASIIMSCSKTITLRFDPLSYVMPKAQMSGGKLITKMTNEQWSLKKRSLVAKKVMVNCLLDLKFLYDWGFLHLDVKPENVLIDLDPETQLPKWIRLCDFSFIEPNDEHYRSTGECCFTFGMRPPEHMLRNAVSDTSDIWSLGATIYEFLIGSVFIPNKGTLRCDGEDFTIHNIGDAVRYFKMCIETKRWLNDLIDVMARMSYPYEDIEMWYRLLSKMIVFDPDQRASITELLASEYFDDMRDEIDEQTKHQFVKYPNLDYQEILERADKDYKIKFNAIHEELDNSIKKDIIIRGVDMFIRYCQNTNKIPLLDENTTDLYRISIFINYKFLMPCGTDKTFKYVFHWLKTNYNYDDKKVYALEADIINELPSIWYHIEHTDEIYKTLFI